MTSSSLNFRPSDPAGQGHPAHAPVLILKPHVPELGALTREGPDVDLADTENNVAEPGYAGSGDNRSALPTAWVVALAECGTHRVPGRGGRGVVGRGEDPGKPALPARLRRDELLTADRNCYSFDGWGTGRQHRGGVAVAGWPAATT